LSAGNAAQVLKLVSAELAAHLLTKRNYFHTTTILKREELPWQGRSRSINNCNIKIQVYDEIQPWVVSEITESNRATQPVTGRTFSRVTHSSKAVIQYMRLYSTLI